MKVSVMSALGTLAVAWVLGAPASDAAGCRACDLAHEQCAVGCSGLDSGRSDMVQCLIGCDNEAAQCSCDEKVTLRSEDVIGAPVVSRAVTAACHSTTPCGSAYGSCASWSAYFDCGTPTCGFAPNCGVDCEPCEPWPPLPVTGGDAPEPNPPGCPCPGPALKQTRERYRVCFNQQQQGCTEYQRITVTLGCGC